MFASELHSLLVPCGPSDVPARLFRTVLPDGGPYYAETNPDALVAEPWNALSSLLFLVPVFIWAVRLRGKYRDHLFLMLCMPLLFTGGLGSALFHAFREYRLFLAMDVIPMGILCIMAGLYFWIRVLRRWWHALAIAVPVYLAEVLILILLPGKVSVNLAYFLTGVFILSPMVWLLARSGWEGWRPALSAAVFLAVSLLFREIDGWRRQPFSMGTHFLWHAFSAVAAYYMAAYLVIIGKKSTRYGTG